MSQNQQQIQELQAKIDTLVATVERVVTLQKATATNIEQRLKDEANRNAKKLRTMEERLSATQGYSIHTENELVPKSIRDELPKKLILFALPMFKGTESPLVHIRAFKSQMAIKGVKPVHWPALFPHSLNSISKNWFYSLDPHKVKTFDNIALEFHRQYRDNDDTQASIRTLEVLSQKENEGFTEYLTRWRTLSSQIPNRPSEDEMVTIFINNLTPAYQGHMRYNNIHNFKQLIRAGTKIEDDMRSGILSNFVGELPTHT